MPLLARSAHNLDHLSAALCAAELGEPYDLGRAPVEMIRELFGAIPELRASVPYATVRLLGRLVGDHRVEVRIGVARALAGLIDSYPERVEELLLVLACDAGRKVRRAAAETLAALIPMVHDPERLIATWQLHPNRAREVLGMAHRLLAALTR